MFKKSYLMLLVSFFLLQNIFAEKMNIVLNDLPKGTKGNLMLIILDSEEAYKSKKPEEKAVLQYIRKDALLNQKEEKFSIDLPKGEYVIQFYMDENKNGKLDTNMFGIPKEKYGFTKMYKGITRPKYKDVVVQLKKETTVVLFTKNK